MPRMDYTPIPASTHVSEMTVEAVEKIGKATSDQIHRLAVSIEAEASALAGKIIGEAKSAADELRAVVVAYQEKTRAMAQEVSNFCLKTSGARAMARGLEGDIAAQFKRVTVDDGKSGLAGRVELVADDGEPSPAFLHRKAEDGQSPC
jgi:hypothetical protein